MAERNVETIGLFLAGAATASGLVTWPIGASDAGLVGAATVGGAGLAAVAFSAGRHGRGDAATIATVAAIGAIVATIAAAGGVLALGPGMAGQSLLAGVIAVLASGGALGAAVVVGRSIPPQRVVRGTRLVIVAAAIGTTGLYLAGATASIAVALPGAVGQDLGPLLDFAFRQLGVGLGFVGAALTFMVLSERGVGYADLAWPDRQDARYAVGGIVAILLVGALIAVMYWLVEIPTTQHALYRRGQEEGAELILLAIPFTWVGAVIGEELLYRNVIQKYLTERLSAITAIGASSAIFAGVHIPAYTPAAPLPVAAALISIFVISLVLAVSYHRTQNVLVPMVIHGCYNVVVYVGIYLQLIGAV